jgi:c(7)-type cytochrome triheme protein
MRTLIACLLTSTLIFTFGLLAADEKKAPDKLTFTSKNGNVPYDHLAHAKRLKDECKSCHDRLFKQDAKVPLDYKAGVHKPNEAAKSSCASCHYPGGTAFESKGNCAKCHVKG